MSIFGVLAKHRNFVAKTAQQAAVLCWAERCERGRCGVLARRECDVNKRRYDCSKFVLHCIDFWAPDKTPIFRCEMALCDVVLCRVERDVCGCRRVLARRVLQCHRATIRPSKGVLQFVDFWAPYEIARNDDEMRAYVAVLCTRGRGERDCRCVI